MKYTTAKIAECVGWVEKNGVFVRYSNPRIGWKEDGTLIVGYHEYPEKVHTVDNLYAVLSSYENNKE